MGVGIYSALGYAGDDVLVTLLAFGDALDADTDALAALPPHARAAGADVVRAIRDFEARVGLRTGAGAERVHTPRGRAIELGNRGHATFGVAHQAACAAVARTLALLLLALGATDVGWFTVD